MAASLQIIYIFLAGYALTVNYGFIYEEERQTDIVIDNYTQYAPENTFKNKITLGEPSNLAKSHALPIKFF